MDTFEVDKIVQQAEIEAYAFNIILEMEQDNVSFEECYYTKSIFNRNILSEEYYSKLKNEIYEYFISSKYDYDEIYVNGMWNY
jgi:hypothetical protein